MRMQVRNDDETNPGPWPARVARRRRAARGMGWVPALILTSACATLFEPPEVRLVSVRLTGLGLGGGTLEAGVVVSNPNRYSLRSSQLSYDLELADPGTAGGRQWTPLAAGQLDREVEVPARDSALVDLPIEFAWDAVGGAIRSLLERGTFDYRVSGELQLRSPIRRTVPYRRTGTLSLGR